MDETQVIDPALEPIENEAEVEVEREREAEPELPAGASEKPRQRRQSRRQLVTAGAPDQKDGTEDAYRRRLAELEAREAAIRQREAELERRAAQAPSLGLHEMAAPVPGRYRVKLPGLKVMRSAVTVEFRENARMHEDDKKRLGHLPPREYDGSQVLAEVGYQPGVTPQAAGWARYAREFGLRPDDQRHFRVRIDPRGSADHLEVQAQSPADAFEIFKVFNGIRATTESPEIERVA